MAKADEDALKLKPPGVGYVANQSSWRKSDGNNGLTVRINNTFPAQTLMKLAANGRFIFKKKDESDDGHQDIFHDDASIPCDSILVFKPDPGKIVRGFSLNLVVWNEGSREDRQIDAGDPGKGLCWSRAEFDCGPAPTTAP